MRLLFYLFIFSQLLYVISAFAGKDKKESSTSNSIKWEKIQEKKSNKLKNIIWESYIDFDSTFEEKNFQNKSNKNFSNSKKDIINFFNTQKINKDFFQDQYHYPLNKFLNNGEYSVSSYWISAFSGGAAGGTGHQNYAFKFDYGLSDDSLVSLIFSETDDPLYKLINGEIIPNNWANIALGYKKKLFESEDFINSLSFVGSLEYWVVSSGFGSSDSANSKKSIYNQIDNKTGLDRHEKFIYSFSLPFTKKLNRKTHFSVIPGGTFIPDKIGDKNIGKNFYGNNYFLSTNLSFDVATNFRLIGRYTYLFGPGNNSFDELLTYYRVPIYSYGFNWTVHPIIDIEGRITNGYGNTPSTSLLTIPSDNKPLYYLGGSFKPSRVDTKFIPLNKNDKLMLFGGVLSDNALFPKRGNSQISFNYDDKGNLFAMYGYSLSNIFQLEIDTGYFNNVNLVDNKNFNLKDTYLSQNNFHYRVGGKLLIFSPQKNDAFWLALRTTLGRNNENKQGYLFSELISTFRFNDYLAFNVSPKYFFSGVKSFGAVGFSSFINLSDKLMLIPEIQTSIINDSDFNSSLALRYSLSQRKSVDLYYSNAVGILDIGQLLEDKNHRLGIKLNFLY